MDKTGRNGLRVGDINSNFKEKYELLVAKHRQMLDKFYEFDYDMSEYEADWFEGIKVLNEFQLIDSEQFLNDALKENKSILAEGAQGTLLDIDFGSYPFVTSSNTVCAGACTGLGVAPNRIGNVIGIFKAYCTRVGMGPFPTELFDEDGQKLRDNGNEYGSTTGRPRRCGWLDLVSLKYSIMINGVTELTMMKSDVMDDFESVKICTSYKVNGQEVEHVPYEMTDDIEPVYTEFKGWQTDMTAMTHENEFPEEFNAYIDFIEKETGVPVKVVSVGPNRAQTIDRMID
jgi:adenylosuccinate synthase